MDWTREINLQALTYTSYTTRCPSSYMTFWKPFGVLDSVMMTIKFLADPMKKCGPEFKGDVSNYIIIIIEAEDIKTY